MSTAVHRSPNKLWRSTSIFNLWLSAWGRDLLLRQRRRRHNRSQDDIQYKDRRRSAKLEREPFQNRRSKPKPRQKKETLSDKKNPSDQEKKTLSDKKRKWPGKGTQAEQKKETLWKPKRNP
jgi:hypothetical protein